jgi:hypothetical protein
VLLKKNEKKLARSFSFTFRYIDDVLSLNNSRFGDFVDRIYPIEFETYPWSFVTQIFHNGQPSQGVDRIIFEVMTSTLPKGIIGSVASILAANLYQGNPDRKKKLARSFNFTFRYIDDVLSLNNSRFGGFVDRIYPIEFEIKNTTDTDRSASYIDLHLAIDSRGRLRRKLYDKRDDLNSASYEKNTSTKHNKYVVNQKLEHVEDISFRELFGRIRVVFYKIRFVSSGASQEKRKEASPIL